MRLFIAIDIDPEMKKCLEVLGKKLIEETGISSGKAAKWVSPQAMHITLKFLGEVESEDVMEVCNVVERVAERKAAFELELDSVGSFGGKCPRVLWVGGGRGSELVNDLHHELEEEMYSAGWDKDSRKFSCHLTLCRIKSRSAGFRLGQAVEKYKDFKSGVVSVDSMVVYQSELTKAGPIYTPLGKFELKGI